jgi:cardiolipin synthase
VNPWTSPPNLLSLLRLVAGPFIAWLIARHDYRIGLAVFFVIGWTDMLDGYLARRYNWSTTLGTYLDPAADKVLLAVVYIWLGLDGALPLFLVWLVIGRDVLILVLCAIGYFQYQMDDFAPSSWGKLSTIIQICGALVILTGRALPDPVMEALTMIAVGLIAVGTTGSGLHYVWIAVKRWQQVTATRMR